MQLATIFLFDAVILTDISSEAALIDPRELKYTWNIAFTKLFSKLSWIFHCYGM